MYIVALWSSIVVHRGLCLKESVDAEEGITALADTIRRQPPRLVRPRPEYAVQSGRAPALHKARRETLPVAYALHPERFVQREPMPPLLPTAAWINRPAMVS
jgi:hypothetical protein